jgi:NAD-dependent SIR2 family protein deacetylase
MIGWPLMANARPNAAHSALAGLEATGYVRSLVTQNVDGLHQRAGSNAVIELHGNIARVVCVDCRAQVSRRSVQQMLESANPQLLRTTVAIAPDGDAELETNEFDAFTIPECAQCCGILKPDVVFFGDAVPRQRVETTLEALAQADALLVVGSSLMIYSGYRFCEHARRLGKPIAAINIGQTRADHLLELKIERPCAEALASLVDELALANVAD